jgi:parallel beta-helix repeat protein
MPHSKGNVLHHEKLRKNKLSFSPRKFVLIICLLLIIPLLIQIKSASGSIIRVPADYGKIQDAVNHALSGDTIQVAAGTYYEHINVPLTLSSLNIIGAGAATTIIDGTANGTIFNLDATNVYITGFTLRNSGDGYYAVMSDRPGPSASNDYQKIFSNIITKNPYGILLSYSNRNTIYNNTFIDNPFESISLTSAGNNNITGNKITKSAYGVRMISSANNILVANTISQASYAIQITGTSSTGNTIRRNTLLGKTAGIYSASDSTTIDHNTITDGAYGIYLYNNKLGSVYYNTFKNNSYGIRLYWLNTPTTSSHTVNNNKILYSDWGIEMVNVNYNTFTGNWIQNNTYGIYMSFSSSNTFYHNNFISNSQGAYAGSGSGNTWYNNLQGNHWSDYKGKDLNGDGIGDTAYPIAPIGSDNYPLMTTWSEHDITVLSVTPSASEVNQGTIVDITVVVKNRANMSTSETFTVTTKYNSTNIETKTVVNLLKGAIQTLTFHWNTAGVALGNYIISAEASTVPDELNTDNNSLSDGTVKIKIPTYDVTINAYCNSESASVSVSITKDGAPTGYNTPHTFTVTSGAHTFTVPGADANGHPFKQWSTGATSTTVTVNSGGTYTAYYEAVHDVAVLSVTATPNTVVQSQNVTISVEVKNEGNVIETFSVTAYYNSTAVGPAQTVTSLSPGSSTTLTFTWDTTGVTLDKYIISANATTVPGETDTTDNTRIDGVVEVKERLMGDVNGNGTVDYADLVLLNQAFGSTGGPPPSANWNPDADFNKDNIIDVQDLLLLGNNYGKTN